MAKGFVIKDNLTKDTLLKIAAMGMISLAALTSPYFLHTIARGYFKEKTKELIRKRAKKLRELQKRKLIEFQEKSDGSVKIVLAHLGKTLVRQYQLENMTITKPQRWDKNWRWIIYDIPANQKKACDALRIKLKKLGLYQLQKSIWVHPYEFMAELEFLCGVFEINMDKYMYYFKTPAISNEKEIKKFFGL